MTYEALENVIRKRFNDNMMGSLAIVFDNQDVDSKQQDIWCRVNIRPGESIQADLGANKRFRVPGIMIVQIFNRTGLGTRAINVIVDRINGFFRAITVGGVTYQTPSVTHLGANKGWYQVNIACPWYSDDVET